MGESVGFHQRLRSRGIFVSLDWVSQCLDYLREDTYISNESLLLGLQEQWLITDLNTPGVMEHSPFPNNVAAITKFQLRQNVCLQVNYGYDIGNSAFRQLQKLYKLVNDNAQISAEDDDSTQSAYQPSQGRYVANWEPQPSRVLCLNITDGFQTIKAIEHERIDVLPDNIPPGVKIELVAPLVCRKGKLLLTQNSVRLLGGEVEELGDENTTEQKLAQKLGQRVDRPEFSFLGNTQMVGQNRPMPQLPNGHTISQPASTPVTKIGEVSTPPMEQARQATVGMDSPSIGNDDCLDWDDADFTLNDEDDALLLSASSEDANQMHQMQEPELLGHIMPSRGLPPPAPLDAKCGFASGNQLFDQQRLDEDTTSCSLKTRLVARVSPMSLVRESPAHTTVQLNGDEVEFELENDLDIFDEIDVDTKSPPKEMSQEPFVYLSVIKKEVEKFPDRRFSVYVKAISSTLVGSMRVNKTNDGPKWYIKMLINDGSDFVQCELSSALLDEELGSPAGYIGQENPEVKAKYKTEINKFSYKLANLSGILHLRWPGGDRLPVLESIQEVTGLHVAKLRRRRLKT